MLKCIHNVRTALVCVICFGENKTGEIMELDYSGKLNNSKLVVDELSSNLETKTKLQ